METADIKLFNINKIVRVFSFPPRKLNYLILLEEKKYLGFTVSKGGLFDKDFEIFLDKLPDNTYQIGNDYYEKEKVVIYYSDGYERHIYFNSEDERRSFLSKNFSSNLWEQA